jgi:hypothetical protein
MHANRDDINLVAVAGGAPRKARKGNEGIGRLSEAIARFIPFGSESEQRLVRIAVNRLGEKGEWDLEELKIELEELDQVDAL